ncbi:MAG: phosphoribosylformylglycinamidine cyclo-ligase [Clostridiales bacterium]|nr:phosphoribosylformylglycinamidine cyclo-ligase [Clostridiales bacterium]
MADHYKAAGVDVHAGYDTVRRIKEHTASTFNEDVLSGIGSFGAFYSLGRYGKMEEPVLISGTDGVGTKLKLAMELDIHNTVGQDCVAMCVNDVACHGAQPLFFLDYLAVGKLFPHVAEQIVAGVAAGCRMAGCALIGGETAEMPGFYPVGEYDLAGFTVGIVDRKDVIDGSAIREGDVLIGIASSGVHSNGFSLVRKVMGDDKESLSVYSAELGDTVGKALLTPTRIYVKAVQAAMAAGKIHGIAHITGGGFIENIPRIIPDGLCAEVEIAKVPMLPVFDVIRRKGEIPLMEMYNIFNMGAGMVMAMDEKDVDAVIRALELSGEKAFVIGRVKAAEEKVELI